MKKFLIIFIVLASSLLAMHIVHAQTNSATNSAAPSHLVFPIPELGNCDSAGACKTYCDAPTHIDACVAYAKAHGFYHPSTLDNQQASILADAKATLGCDSVDSCKTFCADTNNATVCSDFAKKHGLSGGTNAPDNTTLQKAEQELGCSSADACRTFCQQDANRAKCDAFAKENNLRAGNQTLGPGGCTSEDSCKVFCSDPNNFTVCSHFAASTNSTGSAGRTFAGPGGCTSEDSCRQYCQQNPTACHMPPLPSGVQPSGKPTGFAAPTGPLPSLSSAEYCRLYPSHCANTTPSYQPSSITGSATPPPPPNLTYAAYCANTGPGCVLNGTHCVCPTPTLPASDTTKSSTPTPTLQPGSGQTRSVQGATTINIFRWIITQFLGIH